MGTKAESDDDWLTVVYGRYDWLRFCYPVYGRFGLGGLKGCSEVVCSGNEKTGRSKCKNGRRSGRLEEYITISERANRGLYGGGVVLEASGRGNGRR